MWLSNHVFSLTKRLSLTNYIKEIPNNLKHELGIKNKSNLYRLYPFDSKEAIKVKTEEIKQDINVPIKHNLI